jgi:hypothetical protein
MVNDDVVKCPLCGAFSHIQKPELLAALQNTRVREQVENYIRELLESPADHLSPAGAKGAGRDFERDVHNWDPSVPMWQRSPKE